MRAATCVPEQEYRDPATAAPRPGAGRTLLVTIAGATAAVFSDSEEVLAKVAAIYPVCALGDGERFGSPYLSFSVTRTFAGSDLIYQVTALGRQTWACESVQQAVAHLEYLITSGVVLHLTSYLLVHAAVVATKEGGVLLPAASGAGKSTLVASLCHAGFHYLSDEVAVTEIGSAKVLPFPRAICLKDGGWELLCKRNAVSTSVLDATRCDGELVHYLKLPDASSRGGRTTVRHVLFPVRCSGEPARVVRMSRAHAVSLLALHSLNFQRHGSGGLETLARLVEGADVYRLTYDDLDDAVRVISELTRRDTARA